MYLVAATAQKCRISTTSSPIHPSSNRVNCPSNPRPQINNPVRLPSLAGPNPHRKPAPFTPLPKSRKHRSRATPKSEKQGKETTSKTLHQTGDRPKRNICNDLASRQSHKASSSNAAAQFKPIFIFCHSPLAKSPRKAALKCSPVPAHR